MIPAIILILLAGFVAFAIFYKKAPAKASLPEGYKELLESNVAFYKTLSPKDKLQFEEKLKLFLGQTTIEAIDTTADPLDVLLIGSSAVIPTFYFPEYRYYNLRSVLLYPGTFNKEEFLSGGYEQNTLGMVGSGPMQGSMILSRPALRYGFQNTNQPHNTGIHEFVHLIDKEDGDVDGLPESLLPRERHQEWVHLVAETMHRIANGHSDINPYATTNRGEFFAVVSEYFFNAPERFEQNHPELYEMLSVFYKIPSGKNE